MADELSEVWDNAIYKEIASQSLYIEAQRETADPAAKVMLGKLAEQEAKHAEILRKMKAAGWSLSDMNSSALTGLTQSDYLRAPDVLEGAGLQEVLVFAMKREQQSALFYTEMMGTLRQEAAKTLCLRLAQEELKHKLNLEIEYDKLFPEKEN